MEAHDLRDLSHQIRVKDGDRRDCGPGHAREGSEFEWPFTGGNEIACGYRTGLAGRRVVGIEVWG